MNNIPMLGSLSLGIIIGWLIRYFIRRFKKFTPKILGALISVIFGGAIIKFLSFDKSVWWFYPIGLLIGFIIYTITVFWALGPPNKKNGKDNDKFDGSLYKKL